MSDLFKDGVGPALAQGQPGPNLATLGSAVPSGKIWTILEYFITNCTNIAAAFSLFKVPNGGSAGPATCLFNDIFIDANSSYPIPVHEYMEAGATFQANAPGMAVVTSAAASSGATSISVQALPGKLLAGTQIIFGSVTATLTADASAASTSLTVSALSGSISSATTGYAPIITLTISGVEETI